MNPHPSLNNSNTTGPAPKPHSIRHHSKIAPLPGPETRTPQSYAPRWRTPMTTSLKKRRPNMVNPVAACCSLLQPVAASRA